MADLEFEFCELKLSLKRKLKGNCFVLLITFKRHNPISNLFTHLLLICGEVWGESEINLKLEYIH